MGHRTIVVSSKALGSKRSVRVKIYDTLDEMRQASERHSGRQEFPDTLGVTQAWTDDESRIVYVIVRLARGNLSTQIITHEIHHASTALYGASLPDHIDTRAHLNHANERFAHLHSDLATRLVNRLYQLGYYG